MRKFACFLVLALLLVPFTMAMADDSESSPFIVGVWKLVSDTTGTAIIDTEFRFLNPTNLTTVIEYAFFEEDGTFCGCDRDSFEPNKTVVYTALAEKADNLMNCKGTNGALKSIVFLQKGEKIFLDGAIQTGFQTHVFGNVVTTNDITTGSIMTEAGMKAVPITRVTREEIEKIHGQCVKFLGPLQAATPKKPGK